MIACATSGPDFAPRLPQRRPRTQSRDQRNESRVPELERVGRIHAQRCPQLHSVRGKCKTRRHHPDHLSSRAVHRNQTAHNVSINSKVLAPQRIAQHHHAILPGLIISRAQRATQLRSHAQYRKQVGRNRAPHQALRLPLRLQVHFQIRRVGGDLHRSARLLQCDDCALWIVASNFYQLVRLAIR